MTGFKTISFALVQLLISTQLVWAGCGDLDLLFKRLQGLRPGSPIKVSSIRGNPHQGVIDGVFEMPGRGKMVVITEQGGVKATLFFDQLDPTTFEGPLESLTPGMDFTVTSKSGKTYGGTFKRMEVRNGENVVIYTDDKGAEIGLNISKVDETSVRPAPPRPGHPQGPGGQGAPGYPGGYAGAPRAPSPFAPVVPPGGKLQYDQLSSFGEELVTVTGKDGRAYSGFIARNPDGSVALMPGGNVWIKSTPGETPLGHAISGHMIPIENIDPRMSYFGPKIQGVDGLAVDKMYAFTSKSGSVYMGKLKGMTQDGNFLVEIDTVNGKTPPTIETTGLKRDRIASINGKPIDSSGAPQPVVQNPVGLPQQRPRTPQDFAAPPVHPPVAHPPNSSVNNDAIAKIFEGQNSYNRYGDRGQFGKGVMLPDGRQLPIFYQYSDREMAIRAGKLFENVNPARLPRGKTYTFAITDDGQWIFGEVDNGWEVGVKHAHLQNGKPGFVAGEMKIDAHGNITYNLESGSTTEPMIRKGKATMEGLKQRMDRLFQLETGHAPAYTDQVLVPSGPPTPREIAIYCADQSFAKANVLICH